MKLISNKDEKKDSQHRARFSSSYGEKPENPCICFCDPLKGSKQKHAILEEKAWFLNRSHLFYNSGFRGSQFSPRKLADRDNLGIPGTTRLLQFVLRLEKRDEEVNCSRISGVRWRRSVAKRQARIDKLRTLRHSADKTATTTNKTRSTKTRTPEPRTARADARKKKRGGGEEEL